MPELLTALEPVLSVVMACRDASSTIVAQLLALAGQESPVPWEVVVVDNRSRDGSAQVALAHAPLLPALRVVPALERDGPGYARNVGVRAARGRWVVFCDADDVVADGWLAAMARALERHPAVAGRFDAERLNPPRVLASRAVDQTSGLQHTPELSPLPHAGAGNLGVHRALFEQVGGFDESLPVLEDTDLTWRVQEASGTVLHFAPDAVVHVRLRSTGRAMFRQGRTYGRAYAELRRRAALQPAGPAGAARGGPDVAGQRRPAALAGRLARRQPVGPHTAPTR